MSDCELGNIVSPTSNQILDTDAYPFAVPFQIASVTPVFNFISEISLNADFSTSDGYISANFNGDYFINVSVAGTYYVRLSCNGIIWTPVVKFKVVTLTANAFSSITKFTVQLNSESTGFDILIPQLLYGPPISGTIGRLYYVQTLEINITTDISFRTGIQRFYMYGTKIGDLYKSNCAVINFSEDSVYYFRVRLMVNNVWEPYSTVAVNWSN